MHKHKKCRVQQCYSQIIKFTQQHIIKYKSRCSSHTYILSQFPTPIYHTYHKQDSNSPTPQLGATTQEYQLTCTRATTLGLPYTARKATYLQGNNTQVLEPHTLDLSLTPPVKPHTHRAIIRKC